MVCASLGTTACRTAPRRSSRPSPQHQPGVAATLTPVPCLWALPPLPSPRPALELGLFSPLPSGSFGRLDSVQAKKASLDGADEGAQGSTSLQDLGRIIAPGGRSCDGGGGGMPWAGVPRLQVATL